MKGNLRLFVVLVVLAVSSVVMSAAVKYDVAASYECEDIRKG